MAGLLLKRWERTCFCWNFNTFYDKEKVLQRFNLHAYFLEFNYIIFHSRHDKRWVFSLDQQLAMYSMYMLILRASAGESL